MQRKFVILIFFAILAVSPRPATVAHANSSSPDTGSGDLVACRVLEAHSAAWPGVTLVLFHQQNKQDQSRLASLLQQKSGAQVGVKTGSQDWKPATVIRLKNCFGRGLLLFPVGGETPKDGETFLLKFPSEKNGE